MLNRCFFNVLSCLVASNGSFFSDSFSIVLLLYMQGDNSLKKICEQNVFSMLETLMLCVCGGGAGGVKVYLLLK